MTHYNVVFLVKADDNGDAIVKVRAFLEDYERDEWDWYEFGGRWMWSDLVEKNIDKIIKPGTNIYWSKFHDEEVKGKQWEIQFPDGSTAMLDYGDEYPIQQWVHEHPELSEAKDATDPKFFEIIKEMQDAAREGMKWPCEQIKKEFGTPKALWSAMTNPDGEMLAKALSPNPSYSMGYYYITKVCEFADAALWTNDKRFFNVEDSNVFCDEEAIRKEPTKWFLVNCDLHN